MSAPGASGYSEVVTAQAIRFSSAEGRWVLAVTVLGSALVFPDVTLAAAVLAASGGVLAFLTIRRDALEERPAGLGRQAQGSAPQ